MDLKVKVTRYNLYVPESKFARYTSDTWFIAPNSYNTPYVPEYKMDLLEWYTFEEAIDLKTGFKRIQT